MTLRSVLARIVSPLRSWFRATGRRNRLESEMEAELKNHLECLTADLVRAGHTPGEAARRARIALGPALMHKEEMRASLGLRWWDEMWGDLRYAVRLLRKSPGFTAIAAVSLALAIGANTTIYSIAKRVLLERLAVQHPQQLRLFAWSGDKKVVVHGLWGDWDTKDGGVKSTSFSYPIYEQMRRDNHVFEDLFAFKGIGRLNATMNGTAQVVQGEMVSGNYFQQLGVVPQLGRPVLPADDVDGAPPVALISAGLWEREFGSSPAVLGRTIKVNMAAVTIIGVTPRDFTGAKGAQVSPDLFMPFSTQPVVSPHDKGGSLLHDKDATLWWLNIMGRVKPGVSDAQAQAALEVSFQAAVKASLHPGTGDTMPHLALKDGSRGLFEAEGLFAKPIQVLMSVVALVLLLACANIASLLLARSSARQREISVRLALGAGRSRVLRQVLTESLLLSALGGVLGLALAFVGRDALPGLLASPWEHDRINIPFDWGVFAFTTGLTLLTGLLFGIAPAWMATRTEVGSSLKENAQTSTRRRKGLGGKAIVAFQMTLSTVLLVGALLFVRTLYNLSHIDPGFKTNNLLLVEIEQPNARYPHPAELNLHQRIEERLRALPGADAVTVAEVPYLSDSVENSHFRPEGEKRDPNKDQSAYTDVVGSGFFHTMGIPILAGREFNGNDTASSPHVAVINQKLAHDAFPGVNPIGRHFFSHEDDNEGIPGVWIEVVGICGDTLYWDLKNERVGMFYEPYAQAENLNSGMTYEIRTQLKTDALAPAIRRAVQSIDPDLPLIDVRTQHEQIESSMQQERIFAALTAGFGILALALACVGVYGVMAYSVARRTNEIGIRLALGALPRQVLGMVLREASWMALVGIVAGLGTALLLARLIKSMLYGLQPTDPVSLAGGALLLTAVGLAASWIPARRAAGVEPMEALRHE